MLCLPLLTCFYARRVPRSSAGTRAAQAGAGTAWDLLSTPGLKRLMVVNWLLSASWDVHTFVVPMLGHERGFSASTIGLVLGSFALSVTLVRLIIPAACAPPARGHRAARARCWAAGFVFAAYPFAGSPWLMGIAARCCSASRWAACSR